MLLIKYELPLAFISAKKLTCILIGFVWFNQHTSNASKSLFWIQKTWKKVIGIQRHSVLLGKAHTRYSPNDARSHVRQAHWSMLCEITSLLCNSIEKLVEANRLLKYDFIKAAPYQSHKMNMMNSSLVLHSKQNSLTYCLHFRKYSEILSPMRSILIVSL